LTERSRYVSTGLAGPEHIEISSRGTLSDSLIENRIENREELQDAIADSVEEVKDSIRSSVRTSNRDKGSFSVYLTLETAQHLRTLAREWNTSFSTLVEAMCSKCLQKLEGEKSQEEEQPPATTSQGPGNPKPEETLRPEDIKYLKDLKAQWPQLSEEQRNRHRPYIAKIPNSHQFDMTFFSQGGSQAEPSPS